jgi:hypothetical protein
MQGWINIFKSINVMQYINRTKDKMHMIFSIDSKKSFDKVQHPWMSQDKTHEETTNRRNVLQLNEGYISHTHSQHYMNGEQLKLFPL